MGGTRYSILAAAAGLFGALLSAPSRADTPAPPKFFEIETKYIFGFTEGSGIGLEGEKEVSWNTTTSIGKRSGRYFATEFKPEFEFTPNQFMQIEFGPIVASHSIRNVPDLDNIRQLEPSGFFGEVRYLVIDRPASPLAVTISFEPNWRTLDETSGAHVTNFEFETKINADLELVKNRVYLGFNLIYEPETTRVPEGSWEKESTLGLTAAVAFRITSRLTLGVEADYYRHYDGILFNSFTGDALYLGPTFHFQITPKIFVAAAWNAQVWGRETDTSNFLNLEEFSRQRAKLKVAVEF